MEDARELGRTWIVAIGASGDEGLRNIQSLLGQFSPELNAVVMVVLHRSYERLSHLCEVLRTRTSMPVVIASDQEWLREGSCYIGEPTAHLTLLEQGQGGMTADPDQQHRGRTVDLLFRSVAAHAGRRGIGVVLSGALDDGSRGVKAIHAAGGKTMVLLRQPQPRGMPENAISYDGPIDCIGTTREIAEAIRKLVAEDAATRPPNVTA